MRSDSELIGPELTASVRILGRTGSVRQSRHWETTPEAHLVISVLETFISCLILHTTYVTLAFVCDQNLWILTDKQVFLLGTAVLGSDVLLSSEAYLVSSRLHQP